MTKVQQIIFFLIFSCASTAKAQDVHFSQSQMAPTLLSPALSGAFGSEFRGGAIYRSQWQSVPVAYESFLGYFDKKIVAPFMGNSLSYGLTFQQDKAGDAGLSLTQIKLHGSVSRTLSPVVQLAVGLSTGYRIRQFSPDKLSFGSQFQEVYDPNASSGEHFEQTGIGHFDLGTGINAHLNYKQLSADIGFSFDHLTSPSVNFLGETITLAPLTSSYILAQAYLTAKSDLLFNTTYRIQSTYNELVISTGAKYYLNRQVNQDLAISVLLGYRLGDAFFPEFHLYYRNWVGGLSYDIHTSAFQVATGGKGGPEFSVRYISNQVAPPKKVKICPIF